MDTSGSRGLSRQTPPPPTLPEVLILATPLVSIRGDAEHVERWSAWLTKRHVRVTADIDLDADGMIILAGATQGDAFTAGFQFHRGRPSWPVGCDDFTVFWNHLWSDYLSPLEVEMLDILQGSFGPVAFRTQWPVGRYRTDFIWTPNYPWFSRTRLIIECDGVSFHSDPKAVMQDKRRDRWFTEHGFKVLRFSTPEIRTSPQDCVAQVSRTLGEL